MTTDIAAGAATAFLLALYAETPLHPGTGQSTGVIDLPVQRERHTGFPLIPSTSLKGSLREMAERQWEQVDVDQVFGPQGAGADLHAGAFALTDARLLAFPVRSLSHVFLWVTCPLALGRLRRDLQLVGQPLIWSPLSEPKEGELVAAVEELQGEVVLEDLSFTTSFDEGWRDMAKNIASHFLPVGDAHAIYSAKFQQHFTLISDKDFAYLIEHATQVTARVSLNDKKTTTGGEGNLWYEETLPSDTLLYTLVRPERPRRESPTLRDAAAVRKRIASLLSTAGQYLQVGGNETVGHGWCGVRMVESGAGENNG